MKRNKMKWICILTAAALLTAGGLPASAMEDELSAVYDSEQAADETADLTETPAGIPEITDAEEAENIPEISFEVPEVPVAAEEAEAAEEVNEPGTPEETEEAVEETEEPAEENGDAAAEETENTEDAEEVEEASGDEELLKAEDGTPTVTYRTHVQTIGWQDWRKDGAMSGTSGLAKRLEGIQIKVDGVEDLGISYKTHVQSYGWQNYVEDGKTAGTTGQAKRLEAIQIKLTGEAAADYDVYYCVHVQTFGWLNWAKNDEIAGTAGYAKRLEGICIKIQPKGEAAPANLGSHLTAGLYGTVAYATHVQSYGWQSFRRDGALSGTTGLAKRLEALKMHMENVPLSGFIQYRSHVQGIGWQRGWWSSDFVSGTEGQSKRLEAVQIRLYGDIAKEFDVWYRTHVEKYGWTGWAKNGTSCGSEGISYRLEALEVKLLPKGMAAPGSTENNLFTKKIEEAAAESLYIRARAYVESITNNAMTKEQKLRVCFDSFRGKNEHQLWIPLYRGTDWPQRYANYYFDTMGGDCVAFGAAFAYMAKVIGYEDVYTLNSGGHGWAEVNGLIYDPEVSLHGSWYYGLPYSSVPSFQQVRNNASPANTIRMKV